MLENSFWAVFGVRLSPTPSRQPLFETSEKGVPKNLRDKDFADLSGEFSGAACLRTLVLLYSALELLRVRTFFGAVRAIFGALGLCLSNICSGSTCHSLTWLKCQK